jgi:hypothetical protein
MSTFENDQYQWRETYFVLFASAKRPKLEAVVRRLSELDHRLTLAAPSADAHGRFESITVVAPEACSAIDICFTSGEEVVEQCRDLAGELRPSECRGGDLARAHRLGAFDARFDVLHFEQLSDTDDDLDEVFDPGALLMVLEALAELTGGIAVDPQSGSMMD